MLKLLSLRRNRALCSCAGVLDRCKRLPSEMALHRVKVGIGLMQLGQYRYRYAREDQLASLTKLQSLKPLAAGPFFTLKGNF